MIRRLLKFALIGCLLMALLLAGGSWWAYRQLAGSLPQLDGEMAVSGLTAPVTIERDSLGIPTLRAANRADLAFATGLVHGQDRFFQMDLLRRNSAGELAELIGQPLVDQDKRIRLNRFRDVARRRLAVESKESLEVLESYAAGVNAGLKSLKALPFEYLLLGSQPQPWKPEDSMLVIFSMFLDLQDDAFDFEFDRGLLHDSVPQELYDFLMARGSQWDAPIHGSALEVPDIPGPDVFHARRASDVAVDLLQPLDQLTIRERFSLGSNNWAVSGKHTADGRALVADDMHLGIQVPHIWYRASFVWPDETDPARQQRMTGVSLPGTPAMIVGSNGHIAWGFTNTEGDWVDAVIVEVDPSDPDSYQTPEGPRKFERHTEVIQVKDAAAQELEIVSTIWGPIVKRDHQNRPLAIRWVAHDTEGVNFGLLHMERVKTLDDALHQANSSGAPHQNFVVADSSGRIAWTVLGRIPRRIGHDGWLPQSWADGQVRWDGYLNPDEYPRVVDPEIGRLWSANARVVSDELYRVVGDSAYDLGARQQQIRDGLLSLDQATEADMLKIQLDDRALFLQRWQQLLLDVLSSPAAAGDPRRQQLGQHVAQWGERADANSVGYRAVWLFRGRVIAQLSDLLGQRCTQIDKEFSLSKFRRIEGPFWKIVSEQPDHLLDPRFESWDAWLLAAADRVIEAATVNGASMDQFTWGAINTTRIQHPISLAIPALAPWLDMPSRPLDGAWADLPRIQGPKMGASQRMAVSPGREQDGYMHMPCGQSGHPLSPHYADSHPAWEQGQPSPFLPGDPIHTLTLKPSTAP
ncbi:MAG: penicillin acylase family protein [Pirellulaceae bacterium]|nr:penicillin acylase family protein [Pirellulaceae bacterium]